MMENLPVPQPKLGWMVSRLAVASEVAPLSQVSRR